MRFLIFGRLPFDTDDVPPDKVEELRRHADAQNKSLQSLIEDTLKSVATSGVIFTAIEGPQKNFALDCSNFQQVAKKSTKH